MTGEAKRKHCRFYVVRYVPDIVRGEFINVGVLLYSPEQKYLGCLFPPDCRRVKRFHPQADLEMVRSLQEGFEEQIRDNAENLEGYLESLAKSLSNLIQISEPESLLVEEPALEIRKLFDRYVGGAPTTEVQENTRMRIRQRMNAAFVEAGIWQRLERRIPAARYTFPGDPLRFDFGYRPDGEMKLLHALSLQRDNKLAKALAYTMGRVRRKQPATLTAVVGPEPAEERGESARAAAQILEGSDILIEPVSNISGVAASIRRELGG